MPKPKVYIETTIVGYLTARSSRDLVTQSKQQTTKEWWSKERPDFDLFCSPLVLREAGAGDSKASRERLQRLKDIPALDLTEDARDLAEKLVGPGKIPPEYYEDALHIAVATINGIDFLLTWNLTHIANATASAGVRESDSRRRVQSPGHLYSRGTAKHRDMTAQHIEGKKRRRDPIVEEVRETRQEHARAFDYDPKAIFEDLKRYQEESDHEVTAFPPKRLERTA